MKRARMIKFLGVSIAVLASLFFSQAWALEKEDIEEAPGKDLSYLPRISGSIRYEYKAEDFGVYQFQVKYDEFDNGTTKAVEGQHYHLEYYLFSGKSKLEVMRNYENAFKAAGWKMIVPIDLNKLDRGLIVSQKTGAQEIWAEVQVNDDGQDSKGNNIIRYQFEVVEMKGMKQEIEINASEMKKQLDQKGMVTLYGINFDTGKATIKPESYPLLNEVGKLLTDNASLKLSIEGHTDNVGNKDANQKLSEQRAASVKEYLVKNAKIAPDRLSTKGFGDTKPVADNSTEPGRAKNRRVELVKAK